jgi:hypothetical protein
MLGSSVASAECMITAVYMGRTVVVVVDGDRDARTDEARELDTLLGIHRDHNVGRAWAWKLRSAQMQEHEVDLREALGDLLELVDHDRVASEVDGVFDLKLGVLSRVSELDDVAVDGERHRGAQLVHILWSTRAEAVVGALRSRRRGDPDRLGPVRGTRARGGNDHRVPSLQRGDRREVIFRRQLPRQLVLDVLIRHDGKVAPERRFSLGRELALKW